MFDKDTSRLSRLTSLLIHLQSKRLVTATELAERYNISVRTVYRDIRALEEAGVPVFTEEGKGYSILDGFRLPPIMLSESEANALITAEQLILKNKDASFIKEYSSAVLKVKSVLNYKLKDKAELLSDRIQFRQNSDNSTTSNYLAEIQLALTNFNLVQLDYFLPDNNETTSRLIEPFALYSTQENWILIAFCRLRNDFRTFRLDRILKLDILLEKFEPHKLTLSEYFEICRQKYFPQPLT